MSLLLISATIFTFLCSVTVSSEVYIRSSQSQTCPARPCVSAHKFAANVNNYLTFNTSMIFLAGQHHFVEELSFINFQQLLLHSMSDSHTATVIGCNDESWSFLNIDRVYISDLRFNYCAPIFRFVNHLIIENSTFENGILLQLLNCDAMFIRNFFEIGHHLRWINVGGAVLASTSNLTVLECIFRGNGVYVGRAIYANDASTITVANSTFEMMTLKCMSLIIGRYEHNVIGGGTVYSLDSTINISCSTFINNSVEGDECNGGVIQLNSSKLQLYDCMFVNNAAEGSGGVISADLTHMTIESTTFSNNSVVGNGGVIYCTKCIICHLRVMCLFRMQQNMMEEYCILRQHISLERGTALIRIELKLQE